uniref:Hydroxysteroid 17-beta dehydrogenase 2 n=1 Tax=Serinus canaria TaxID=9135 RepID=A0A8C9MVG7_SERCA
MCSFFWGGVCTSCTLCLSCTYFNAVVWCHLFETLCEIWAICICSCRSSLLWPGVTIPLTGVILMEFFSWCVAALCFLLFPGLWGVVNNAGILGFPADGELLPMSTYRHCMEVNFFGAVEVSKTFLPLLRRSQGRLVNMSSMAGGIPLPRYAAYGASKAALSMFSGVMRQELSKWGIKVMAIHPSGFRTGIEGTAEQWDKQEKELMENLPADTRQAYGEEYLLGLRNYLLHLPSHCAPDLSPVLGSVLHALLARRPQGLYTPGKGAYVPLCIFCCFPLWFYDFFISKVLSAGSVPRQLRASGDESKNL